MELSLIEEQRINIKFLAKLGKNGREIFECLKQVYGDNSLKEPTVNKWLKRFREGREDVKDDQRSGRPSTSTSEENVERIRDASERDVLRDRLSTARTLAAASTSEESDRRLLIKTESLGLLIWKSAPDIQRIRGQQDSL
ncbi:PREDICTED: putative uncharacterized protein FLJ37770 [Cyphomyrmex costatus]|uniref:putative uncharacterized protein FLJ37770 n=1 Tax=Cyphomyrmex costatus TaxID=456900 RepID=UPI00085232C9|nr:PREDICTED: putative uncharacterized protein FLJ37770 [Cyphomyrmex costatus]